MRSRSTRMPTPHAWAGSSTGRSARRAVRAHAAERKLPVVEREARRAGGALGVAGVHARIDVLDAPAYAADHVMVLGRARVVDRGAPRGAHAAHEAELVEQLERAVD